MVKSLLMTTAVAEAVVGLALLASPSLVTAFMLGSALEAGVAVAIARVAGIALCALGVACWLARSDGQTRAARGLVSALCFYNAAMCGLLIYEALGAGLSGVALWPTVVLHAAMGAWCFKSLAAKGV
jgi:hypothetical protein